MITFPSSTPTTIATTVEAAARRIVAAIIMDPTWRSDLAASCEKARQMGHQVAFQANAGLVGVKVPPGVTVAAVCADAGQRASAILEEIAQEGPRVIVEKYLDILPEEVRPLVVGQATEQPIAAVIPIRPHK